MEERQGKSEINELLTLMAGDLMAGGQPRPGRQGIAIAAIRHGEKKTRQNERPARVESDLPRLFFLGSTNLVFAESDLPNH
jgi:uncharacterized Ntn-hydrolase superfamily protein